MGPAHTIDLSAGDDISCDIDDTPVLCCSVEASQDIFGDEDEINGTGRSIGICHVR